MRLQQRSEVAKIDIQFPFRKTEQRLHFAHLLIQTIQRDAHALDLRLGKGRIIHPANGLVLNDPPQQFDDREHESRQVSLHRLRIDLHPLRESLGHAHDLGCDRIGKTARGLTP